MPSATGSTDVSKSGVPSEMLPFSGVILTLEFCAQIGETARITLVGCTDANLCEKFVPIRQDNIGETIA